MTRLELRKFDNDNGGVDAGCSNIVIDVAWGGAPMESKLGEKSSCPERLLPGEWKQKRQEGWGKASRSDQGSGLTQQVSAPDFMYKFKRAAESCERTRQAGAQRGAR